MLILKKGVKEYVTTIKHNRRTNTPVLRSTPDNLAYNPFCTAYEKVEKASELETTIMATDVVERTED